MSHICEAKFRNSDHGVVVAIAAEYSVLTLWVKVSGLVARYHNFILVLDQTILKNTALVLKTLK